MQLLEVIEDYIYIYGFLLGKNFLSVAEENTNP